METGSVSKKQQPNQRVKNSATKNVYTRQPMVLQWTSWKYSHREAGCSWPPTSNYIHVHL